MSKTHRADVLDMALLKGEGLFHAIFDQAGVGIAHVGLDGRLLRVNRRFCQIVGRSREDLEGLRFQDITHPDDLAVDLARSAALLKGEAGSFAVEKRYLDATGRPRWTELVVALARRPDGSPDSFVSVVQDIARRKRHEAELLRNRRAVGLYAGLVNDTLSAPDAPLAELWTDLVRNARAMTDSPLGFAGALVEAVRTFPDPTAAGDGWGADPEALHQALAGVAGRRPASLLSNAPATDPRLAEAPDFLRRLERLVLAPAIIDGIAIGYIATANGGEAYGEDELAWIEQVADLLALVWRHRRDGALLRDMARFPADNPNPLIRLDLTGRILLINGPADRILPAGPPREVLPEAATPPGGDNARLGEEVWDRFAREAAGALEPHNATVHFAGRTFSFDVVPVAAEGYVNVYGKEITDRVRAEVALRMARDNLALAQEIANVGNWEWGPELPAAWSDQMYRILGLEPGSVPASGQLYLGFVHPRDRAVVEEIQARRLRGADVDEYEHRLIRADGLERHVRVRARALRDAEGRVTRMMGVVHDITEQKEHERQIEHLANFDALTDLPNRALFEDRVGQAVARFNRGGPAFAVLFLDLDHFKDVNDTLGHPMGDQLLRAVARRLVEVVRETDTVSRFGGDEFAVLQSDLHDYANAGTLAEKLCEALARPFELDGHTIHSSTSVGIAVFAGTGNVSSMLAQADTALYEAKEAGRNTFRFHTGAMDEAIHQRVALGGELRRALAGDELFLVYQPQVDLETGRVVGVEALVRWRHPERGDLPPSAFVPVAESTGLILPLGRWVLRRACEEASAWLDAGLDFGVVAVNVSSLEFRARAFEGEVAAALSDSGLDPRRLELELTETAIMEISSHTNGTIGRLREMGVRLSVDDFGTGYSSLQYLRALPIDRLKVAQEFIRGVGRDKDDSVITAAAISLGRQLGLTVVAEGVDSELQLEFLREHGCHAAQGYRFSEPLRAPELVAYLRAERGDAPAESPPGAAD